MLTCQITKRLQNFVLQIDLTAGPGVTALFGPSGSGKSLTLQAIAGLIRPDSGRIQLGDRTLYDSGAQIDLPPQQRRTGYVFQHYALFPHLTVAQNIAYGLHRLPRAEQQERVAKALAQVQLTGMEGRRPGQLSGGQQQRVALARALVTRPEILLLDEPFAALDQATRLSLHAQLLAVLRELAIPTLLVTHQLEEAYALCRQIAVYEAGRIIQSGSREAVYERPATLSAARFVGVRNMLPGVIRSVQDGLATVDGPGFTLYGQAGGLLPGRRVICAIRPEHVMLVRKDSPGPGAGRVETVLTGHIVEEIPYGGEVSLRFRPAGAVPAELVIALPAYVYDRLGLATEKAWDLVLKPDYLRIYPDDTAK